MKNQLCWITSNNNNNNNNNSVNVFLMVVNNNNNNSSNNSNNNLINISVRKWLQSFMILRDQIARHLPSCSCVASFLPLVRLIPMMLTLPVAVTAHQGTVSVWALRCDLCLSFSVACLEAIRVVPLYGVRVWISGSVTNWVKQVWIALPEMLSKSNFSCFE